MRKQLDLDIKGCCNQDLAATLKALFEAYNLLAADHATLVSEVDALVDQLEADKADISTTDFAALVPTAATSRAVDID